MRALRAKLTAKHLRKPDSYSCSMRKAPSSEEVQFAHRSIDNRIGFYFGPHAAMQLFDEYR